MDIDMSGGFDHSASSNHPNAQAGPSSYSNGMIPVVYLPPPGPPRRKPLFDSTQDLMARFQLLGAYDKYVRPYAHPVGTDGASDALAYQTLGNPPTPGGASFQASTPGGIDKGKAREMSVVPPRTPVAPDTPMAVDGADDDADDDGGKGDKKRKNNYKHLIRGLPGKHSMKKDDYLQSVMFAPPKQKMQIAKFDLRTQREAFTVSMEGLKGWQVNTLVAESAQAREDRKRRKELKKIAKAQGANVPPLSAPPLSAGANPSQLPSTSLPTPASTTSRGPQTPTSLGVGTPRPHGPGPGPPTQSHHASHAHTRPGTPATGRPSTPLTRPGSADPLVKRGKKREHEEGAGAQGGYTASLNGKPRPMKKPRTDGAPGTPQQQPTPQAVQ